MGSQVGYGHSDTAGAQPFDYYYLPAGPTLTIKMQTGVLVLDSAAAISAGALTIDLPYAPVDGATAEILSTLGVTSGNTITVAVPSGDPTAVGISANSTAPTAILAAGVAGTTVAPIVYKFTQFGDILTQSVASTPPEGLPQGAPVGKNAGYWIRVQ